MFGFQPVHAGGSSGRDRASSPVNKFDSGAASPPRSSCRCKEYSLRIVDLEGRLSLMKRQAKLALDKASKSCGFMKQISVLEDKVSGLMAKSYISKNVTPFSLVLSSLSARCCDVRFLAAFLFSLSFHYCWLMPCCYLRYLSGLCW
jgi:hypothetical protein